MEALEGDQMKRSDAKCGYLYVTSGSKYLQEAYDSAGSLRRVEPSCSITLVTGSQVQSPLFNHVILRPHDPFLEEKFDPLTWRLKWIYHDSPYEKTLFLDSDTYVSEAVSSVFQILDQFDICIAPGPNMYATCSIAGERVPGLLAYNCGVIAFRKNAITEDLFDRWFQIYQEKMRKSAGNLPRDQAGDQVSFVEAAMAAKARLYVLANTWNARIPYYLQLRGTVRIIHGRSNNLERIRARINVTTQQRCWDPEKRICIYKNRSRLQSLIRRIRRRLSAPGSWHGRNLPK